MRDKSCNCPAQAIVGKTTSFFLKRFLQFLLVLTGCIHLCGGPLGLLQCVAWMKMVITYSQTDGVQEGLKMTFDGEHPCEMCRMISQATKQSPSTPEAPTPDTKIGKILNEFSLADEIKLPIRNTSAQMVGKLTIHLQSIEDRDGSPPVPPPRLG